MKRVWLKAWCVAGILSVVLSACNGPKLSVADEQYARGEYFDASKTYRKVYNKLTKKEERALRGEVAYKMGLCHDRLNQPRRAEAAFANAIRYGYADSTAYALLGKQQHANGEYQAAITSYGKYLEFSPKDSALIRERIRGCRNAIEQGKTQSRYIVKRADLFNSSRSDYAPMFYGDDCDQLYFTSTTEKATGTKKSEITGAKNGDIFFSKKNENGVWQRPEPIEGEVNTELDEGIVSFTPDGNTMYLTKARREANAPTSVEIYTSTRSEAKWSAPVKYEITADTISSYGHPAISPDGRWLYFASDMPGGYGGLDIWKVNLTDRAGTLENLGEQINTAGNEEFPYWRDDNTFYFASNGHAGYGGLDLFKATQTSTGYWNIENMGRPINSEADDFGITFSKGESGYFSSNRKDARGYDHIYSFELPELKIGISGYVLDKDEEPIANAIIRIVGDDGSNQKEVSRDDGSFKFRLQRGVHYVMLAGAKGYLNNRQEFTSDSEEEDADYVIDFLLASVSKAQVLENIFYDFNQATIRSESKEGLDAMAKLLIENPHIAIEMAAHTDRIASDGFNMELSKRRAQAVVDYLISAGVDAGRLHPQGYGKRSPKVITKRLNRLYPQFPIGKELTEQYIDSLPAEDKIIADQINRRTEFRVTSLDYTAPDIPLSAEQQKAKEAKEAELKQQQAEKKAREETKVKADEMKKAKEAEKKAKEQAYKAKSKENAKAKDKTTKADKEEPKTKADAISKVDATTKADAQKAVATPAVETPTVTQAKTKADSKESVTPTVADTAVKTDNTIKADISAKVDTVAIPAIATTLQVADTATADDSSKKASKSVKADKKSSEQSKSKDRQKKSDKKKSSSRSKRSQDESSSEQSDDSTSDEVKAEPKHSVRRSK